jgi:hypothetical protein
MTAQIANLNDNVEEQLDLRSDQRMRRQSLKGHADAWPTALSTPRRITTSVG